MSEIWGRWTEVGVKGHFYRLLLLKCGESAFRNLLYYGLSAGVKGHILRNVL